MNETPNSSTENKADMSLAEVGQQTVQATPENLNAFQKFLNGIFGGDKIKEAEPKGETSPAADAETDGKAFTQAELDAAIESAKQKWADEAAEAKRQSKLTPEEKELEQRQLNESKILELEKRLLQKELRENAVKALEKDGYPSGLADILDYSGEDAMKKSLETLTDVFKSSIESAVLTRLKGKTPEMTQNSGAQNILREQIAKSIRGE